MSIVAPKQRDFDIILEDLGQTITLRKYTRTTDSDGRITNVSYADTSITAVVEEIRPKKKELLAGGHYKIGDIDFFVSPDVDVTIFDKIIWGTKLMGIKEVKYDQKIAGFYVLKILHCVKDSNL